LLLARLGDQGAGMLTADQPRIAVAGDGSTLHREPSAASALTAMVTTATLLGEHTGLDTTAVLVPTASVEELISGLRRLAPDVSAIYLAHTDPARARTVRAALSDTVPVITEEQTVATATTSATLTALERARVLPAAACVVLVGPHQAALVGALDAAGIGEVMSWDPGNGSARGELPGHATVLVDLLGTVTTSVAPEPPAVIRASDPIPPLLAVPELLASVRAGAPRTMSVRRRRGWGSAARPRFPMWRS
jgi:hypothetical protein